MRQWRRKPMLSRFTRLGVSDLTSLCIYYLATQNFRSCMTCVTRKGIPSFCPHSLFHISYTNASEEETQILYNRQSLGISRIFHVNIKPRVNFDNCILRVKNPEIHAATQISSKKHADGSFIWTSNEFSRMY